MKYMDNIMLERGMYMHGYAKQGAWKVGVENFVQESMEARVQDMECIHGKIFNADSSWLGKTLSK